MLWPTGTLDDLRVLLQLKGLKQQEQSAIMAEVAASGSVSSGERGKSGANLTAKKSTGFFSRGLSDLKSATRNAAKGLVRK